jgi:hypothetical protein
LGCGVVMLRLHWTVRFWVIELVVDGDGDGNGNGDGNDDGDGEGRSWMGLAVLRRRVGVMFPSRPNLQEPHCQPRAKF